jgi:hypothetical protein
MFRTVRTIAVLAGLFGAVAPAAALYTHYENERFGPAPKGEQPPNPEPLWTLKHSPKVVYEQATGWWGFGAACDEIVLASQGDVDDVNRALELFAALPADRRELRLFPGPGSVYSLKGQRISCDWQLHWTSRTVFPGGDHKEPGTTRTAVLTIYVARTGPIPPADPRAAGWIGELNDDRFEARQRATAALAALGDAAVPALRHALPGATTIEQRRRIDLLLERLKPIHLARLIVPRGVAVVSLDQLLEQETKNWRKGDLGTSYYASVRICEFAEYADAAWPLLLETLRDSREQVRAQTVKTLERLGKRGASLLPELRAAEATAAAHRDALRQAIAALEKAPPGDDVAAQEEARRRRYEDIATHCRKLTSAR